MNEPLVLVPGLACTAELFGPQLTALSTGRMVLVAEQRLDDTLGGMAERLLAAAPPRFALCGLSMGGYVACEVLRRAPGRVSRLALLDTSAKPATPETNAPRLELIALAQGGQFDRAMAMLWPRLVAPDRRRDQALGTIVRRMAADTGPDAFERQQRAIMARPDSRPVLSTVDVPSLVLVGELDILTPPAEAHDIAGALRGARLVTVPACGHLATLEQPEIVSRELEAWLAA